MAQYDTTWFEKGLAELEITLNEKQIEQFLTYYELLVEWNKVMNLTGHYRIRRSHHQALPGQRSVCQSV